MATFEGWPAGIEARPLDKADVPAWVDLLAACEKIDHTGENYDDADLLEELDDPSLDLASWKTRFTGARAFRPDLSFLILDGEQIVSYALGYEFVADIEPPASATCGPARSAPGAHIAAAVWPGSLSRR